MPTVVVPTPTQPPVPTQVPAPTPTPSTGGGNQYPAAAQAVLTLINQERAGANLPPLQMDNRLINSAHKHNLRMLAANQLSHQLSGEAPFGDRISAEGVVWHSAAENIAYNYGDPTTAATNSNKSMFAETPPNDGHRQNILSTSSNIIGIDVLVNPQNNQVWLTEDFAGV